MSRITLALLLAGLGVLLTSSAIVAQDGAAATAGQQVVLVTGSTSGLGREVALRMGARGAHVIVHGRDRDRGMAVVGEINGGPGSARFYAADFASFDQVRGLAAAVLRDYERLDVLVNNAGFGSAPDERWLSDDGHELRFQVNYLAPYLLTDLLLPRIRQSIPSRIVNVSSLAQLVPQRANGQAYDMESRRRLRELSRELTGSR